MARITSVRERTHQPFWDALIGSFRPYVPQWEDFAPKEIASRLRANDLDEEAQRWLALILLDRGTIDDIA